jgi:hypothetical protein
MFASGWLRLCVVLTGFLLVGAPVGSVCYVWLPEVCYKFVTVSIQDSAGPQDRELANWISKETSTKTLRGTYLTSPLLTLEGLAGRGVVYQVAVQWFEPNGWSTDHGEILIFDTEEIRASEIVSLVSSYVHRPRMRKSFWFLGSTLVACLGMLLLGIGVAWVRRGFAMTK